MTTETEELLARLPEIEAKAKKWMLRGILDLELGVSIVGNDVPSLCAAVRDLAAENERLRAKAHQLEIDLIFTQEEANGWAEAAE